MNYWVYPQDAAKVGPTYGKTPEMIEFFNRIYGYDYPPWEDATTGYSELTPVGGLTFRRPDKELLTFEVDSNGDVIRIKRNNNYLFPREK